MIGAAPIGGVGLGSLRDVERHVGGIRHLQPHSWRATTRVGDGAVEADEILEERPERRETAACRPPAAPDICHTSSVSWQHVRTAKHGNPYTFQLVQGSPVSRLSRPARCGLPAMHAGVTKTPCLLSHSIRAVDPHHVGRGSRTPVRRGAKEQPTARRVW